MEREAQQMQPQPPSWPHRPYKTYTSLIFQTNISEYLPGKGTHPSKETTGLVLLEGE
jgi:hypothetical protein